jgi:hypothetical protein
MLIGQRPYREPPVKRYVIRSERNGQQKRQVGATAISSLSLSAHIGMDSEMIAKLLS